jgi:hypothetical protein
MTNLPSGHEGELHSAHRPPGRGLVGDAASPMMRVAVGSRTDVAFRSDRHGRIVGERRKPGQARARVKGPNSKGTKVALQLGAFMAQTSKKI